MPKESIIPCTKEEMDKLIEASIESDFYYMFFNVAKFTGRRIGELWGNQKKKEVGRKVIGKKIEYDKDGKEVAFARTRPIYKLVPNEWVGGIKVKDINFDEGLMKVWVLKRRKLEQDETVLPKEVLTLIKHYVIKNNLKPEDYLFREKAYSSIQAAVSNYAKKAGITHKVSVHNFRHYFVTELKRKGWSNDQIQKLTGHKTTTMLAIYDHIVARDIKDKVLEDLKGL